MRKTCVRAVTTILLFAIISSLAGCSALSGGKESAKSAGKTYAELLFDTSVVHTVDVVISDEDWADLKQNPLEKTKYIATVTIDGETIEGVSFATKGVSCLTQVAADESSDRYSFKINFGKFVHGQTYHGLNKLNLHSCFADATYMKDHISYEMFRRTGVDAPLSSFVWLTVNGEPHGLYNAIEDISEAFLERTADGEGVLYKPEKAEDNGSTAEADEPVRGASLLYTDDSIGSYPDIFENAETDANENDMRRVITALKGLSTGSDLDSLLDKDEVIRYFAVNTFLINYDSYVSSMLHNYYLYERDGKLAMIPWDYNMAFGTFFALPELVKYQGHSTELINVGIDSPLVEIPAEERPMWRWIVEDDLALQSYHDVLDSLISDYIDSGEYEKEIDALYELLLPYVEKDPTAFYSAQEFTAGVQTLKQFIVKRAESIRAQLNGSLSAVTDEQRTEDRIDCSDVYIPYLGLRIRLAAS